jgi:hypothetical protein
MPPTPIVVLEIDDNTPPHVPPFTNDVSMWSFEHDLNLGTRTAAETFRAFHEALDGSKFRGYPERVARATFAVFNGRVQAEEVTWLSGTELAASAALIPTGGASIERSLRKLFDTVAVTGRQFGMDRVRLVFTFS